MAMSAELCELQCFLEISCQSYNYGPKENGVQVCELSDSDAIGDPLDWTIKQGWNKGVTHWLILGHNNQTLLGS